MIFCLLLFFFHFLIPASKWKLFTHLRPRKLDQAPRHGILSHHHLHPNVVLAQVWAGGAGPDSQLRAWINFVLNQSSCDQGKTDLVVGVPTSLQFGFSSFLVGLCAAYIFSIKRLFVFKHDLKYENENKSLPWHLTSKYWLRGMDDEFVEGRDKFPRRTSTSTESTEVPLHLKRYLEWGHSKQNNHCDGDDDDEEDGSKLQMKIMMATKDYLYFNRHLASSTIFLHWLVSGW